MFPGGRERVHLGTNGLTCYDLEIFQESAFTSFVISLFNLFHALPEKCANTEFFLVRIQENTDQKKNLTNNFSRRTVKEKR